MTTLDAITGLVLTSDPVECVIYTLNVNGGTAAVAIDLPDLKAVQGDAPFMGFDGLKIRDDVLIPHEQRPTPSLPTSKQSQRHRRALSDKYQHANPIW